MRLQIVYVTLVAGSLIAGCGKESADEHLARADGYFGNEQFPEAIVEYRRAIQIDPQLGDARLKLGDAYARTNDPVNAIKEYVRASDLLPDNNDAQLKAASGLLLAGRFEEARSRADKVLEANPGNATAQILRGNALAGLKDFDGAISEYESAIASSPSQHEAFVNLGTIQSLKGNPGEAEAAFKKAVDAAPRSVQARLALANFYWSANKQADAESSLQAALELEPENAPATRALGLFYMATGRVAEAEPYFKRLADKENTPAIRATLAQYYVLANRRDDARKTLNEILSMKDGESIATTRLAALDALDGQLAQAENRLREFVLKAPGDLSAQLLYGELLLRTNKRDEAAAAAKAAVGIDANSARAHMLSAAVAISSDRTDDAIKELETVISLDGRALGALIQLSRLQLGLRNGDKSIGYAQQALQVAPRSPEAQSLLVRNYLLQGNGAKAEEIVTGLQKEYPDTPGLHNLMALIQLSKKNSAGAAASYTRALALDAANIEALAGLTRLDLAARRTAQAEARLNAAAARADASPDLLLMVAQGYEALGASDRSEAVLKRAIEIDPGRLQAYSVLGRLYASQNRLSEARQQFSALLAKNSTSVPGHTMLGMIEEALGNGAEAEKAYEQALAADARAAVAANNLAWIYVSTDRKLDDAMRLAQTAAEQLSSEPAVNDTLGWIYVKKDMAARAVPVLEAAIKGNPNDASFHYHLGTAYYQAGEWTKAKASLQKALELQPDFAGADQARKTLAVVGG